MLYICSVKIIKNILATVSLLTFAVSLAFFVIGALVDSYGNLAWSGMISFAVMLVAAGTPDNTTYLRNRCR